MMLLVPTVQQDESVTGVHVSYPSRLPSPSGHHRALGRVPCAIRYVIISYLFYNILYTISIAYMCQSQSPSSSLLTTLWNIEILNCLPFLRKTI